MLEWLDRLLNLSFDMGVVPMDWRAACIVSLYKWKGDKCECGNSRGISLLSAVGRLYGRVLIKRVRAGTECAIGKEQCGFRQSRGCMDKWVCSKAYCENYLANGKDIFLTFMDLEKAYDTIDWHGMWKMLRVYGVGGTLLKAVQSFYIDSRTCFRLGNDLSEWFPVNVGLRHGCVMSPWLFNVHTKGVVRDLNVMVHGKVLELLSANGGRFEINQLLFTDNTALVADSEEKLCKVCKRRKLRVNAGKS